MDGTLVQDHHRVQDELLRNLLAVWENFVAYQLDHLAVDRFVQDQLIETAILNDANAANE